MEWKRGKKQKEKHIESKASRVLGHSNVLYILLLQKWTTQGKERVRERQRVELRGSTLKEEKPCRKVQLNGHEQGTSHHNITLPKLFLCFKKLITGINTYSHYVGKQEVCVHENSIENEELYTFFCGSSSSYSELPKLHNDQHKSILQYYCSLNNRSAIDLLLKPTTLCWFYLFSLFFATLFVCIAKKRKKKVPYITGINSEQRKNSTKWLEYMWYLVNVWKLAWTDVRFLASIIKSSPVFHSK